MNSSASRAVGTGLRFWAEKRWISSSVNPGVVRMEVSGSTRLGDHPRFLPQFAPGAGLGRLARFEPTGGDFPEVSVGGVAELAQHEDPRIGGSGRVEKGHDGSGTGMA